MPRSLKLLRSCLTRYPPGLLDLRVVCPGLLDERAAGGGGGPDHVVGIVRGAGGGQGGRGHGEEGCVEPHPEPPEGMHAFIGEYRISIKGGVVESF